MTFHERIKSAHRGFPVGLRTFSGLVFSKFPLRLRHRIGCNNTFRKVYDFILHSDFWPPEKYEEYQILLLRWILRGSNDHVPYYKKMFRDQDLRPCEILTLEDLKKIPFLTKKIVQTRPENFVSRRYSNREIATFTTGGTSGIPMVIYYHKWQGPSKELAFMMSLWSRVGVGFGDKTVIFDPNVTRKTLFHYEGVNQLFISLYRMTEQNLVQIVQEIRKFKPKIIRGFPSIITMLAKFMESHGLEPFSSVQTIFCGSENIYSSQRKVIQNFFGCRMFTWYGHTEQSVLAGECEFSTYYHCLPQYGITELIGKNGERILEENRVGEIVATGLTNDVMPLVRYRTMDLGVYSNQECACGRKHLILKNIEGRIHEFVINKTGQLISLTALIGGSHFSAFQNIMDMQLIQHEKGRVTIKIVKGKKYSSTDEKEIRNGFLKIGLHVEFNYVHDIARTKRGKRVYLISTMPRPGEVIC